MFYMMLSMSVYGVSYRLPTLVKGFGVSNTMNGLINIPPWLAATIVLATLPSLLRQGNRVLAAMSAAALLGVVAFLGSVKAPMLIPATCLLLFGGASLVLLLRSRRLAPAT